MKKFLSAILSLAMILSIITVPQLTYAAAEENVYYFTDFDCSKTELLNDGWSVYTATHGDERIKTIENENGESVLKMNGAAESGYESVTFSTPTISNPSFVKGEASSHTDGFRVFHGDDVHTFPFFAAQDSEENIGWNLLFSLFLRVPP